MSIVERLFPASELEALRATPYDFDLAPNPKRRKLSSSACEIIPNTNRSSSDSGYDSDVSSQFSGPSLPTRKRTRTSTSTTSSSASTPAPFQTGSAQSALFHKYLSSLPPTDRAKFRLRTHSNPSLVTPETLKDFYHQITQARSRSRASISGLPTPPYSNGGSSTNLHQNPLFSTPTNDEAESIVRDVGQGWTAGPKSAMEAHLSARIFDGIRITSHERSMLHALIPESPLLATPAVPATAVPPQRRQTFPTFSYPQQRVSVQLPVPTAPSSASFAGIAIGAYNDEEEDDEYLTQDLDGYDLHIEGEGTGKVEDFFNIEEACDDSPIASADEEDEV